MFTTYPKQRETKSLLLFLVMFHSIVAIASPCYAAVDLAQGKPYTVSPRQNYPLSAPSSDTTALTDGIYTVWNFWSKKTTVGWQNEKTVEILIDLYLESNIGKIVLSSVRGKEADVYYPSHITAFVGNDPKRLAYAGDLAIDPDNLPGSYQTKKFTLNDVGLSGRYVLLVVIPKGIYFFCDEIEVHKGLTGQRKTGEYTIEKIHDFADQLMQLDRAKELLGNMAKDLSSFVDNQSGVSRLSEINKQISELQTTSKTDAIEAELLSIRGNQLSKTILSNPLHVQTICPWATLNPMSSLTNNTNNTLSLISLKGGYDSSAVLVTNLSTTSMPITVNLDKVPYNLDLMVYQVPFIKTGAMEQVPDPLVPLSSDLILRSGESRMLFVTAFGKQSGSWETALRINNDGNVTKVPINIHVSNVDWTEKLTLNSINWSYLEFKLMRDRQQAAFKDLSAHHTNVVAVPPKYLPLHSFDKDPDFSEFKRYLGQHDKMDKVMVYIGKLKIVYSGGSTGEFLGGPWKTGFLKWYEGLLKAATESGYLPEQVYLYPYDEMHDDEVNQFISFAVWAKDAIPSIRFYATLSVKGALRALPYLDIAQVLNNDELLNSIKPSETEIWIYNCSGPAKSLSPYIYYRLMAWKAFLRGYKGIGFWAYADSGWGENPGAAWDDFDGKYPDFAVIYEGEGNSIISSRRWEAWRMGIEDYELLKMYAKFKGDGAAHALAQDVFGNPGETERADIVRKKIISEISDNQPYPPVINRIMTN